jgi:phosphate transport system permease protein
LFREGSKIFDRYKIEDGYAVVVNNENPISRLTPRELRNINTKEIDSWAQVGWHSEKIEIFSLDNLDEKFSKEELGDKFENAENLIFEYIESHPYSLGIFPKKYLHPKLTRIKLEKVTLSSIIFNNEWYPNSNPFPDFGAFAIIYGSLYVSLFAMFFAVPIGLIAAIYNAEIGSKTWVQIQRPIIELLSGIPSVILGLFGLVFVVPIIKETFTLDRGETALAGSIVLAIIALPTMISICEDALRSVNRETKEASLALGATHLQTILKVSLPMAKSGIVSAIILCAGRAFGETMAVLMVTGNSTLIPDSPFQSVRTITGTIASELGEAPVGSLHYESLFILGSILFFITFLFNLIASAISGSYNVSKIKT